MFDFIRRILLVEINGDEPQYYRRAVIRFAMKFQQVTSAVMAKGLEDTAFYRYNRLVSLNEVGGDPGKFGVTVDEFHRANQARLEFWPHSMLATSTHDSKRSEDVRTRIDVISEIPAAWRMSLRRWRDWNRSRRLVVDGVPVPLRNDEYLIYQTLLGAWPVEGLDDEAWQRFVERIDGYILKAMREAKAHTSWASPNEEYEKSVSSFLRAILTRGKKNRFLPDFGEFQRRVSRMGMFNSLSQTVLKLTSPGVPDIYQGNELWDYSLVDPDNRRPVDYERRRNLLKSLQASRGPGDRAGLAQELLDNMDDGRIKLYVTSRALCARRQNPDLFQTGAYVRVEAQGAKAEHVVAFARQTNRRQAIVVAPRLIATLLGDKQLAPVGPEIWGDTRLELPSTLQGQRLRNVFTNDVVQVNSNGSHAVLLSSVLEKFPVALLLGEPA